MNDGIAGFECLDKRDHRMATHRSESLSSLGLRSIYRPLSCGSSINPHSRIHIGGTQAMVDTVSRTRRAADGVRVIDL